MWLQKKGMTTNFFYPALLLLFLDLGSEIWDMASGIQDRGSGMGKNQDPGSGINIPDLQHWSRSSQSTNQSSINVCIFCIGFALPPSEGSCQATNQSINQQTDIPCDPVYQSINQSFHQNVRATCVEFHAHH